MSEDSFDNVGNALRRLNEALLRSTDDSLVIDATIQRFEFCIELMWKLFRRLILEEKQNVEPFPKPVMQKAYAAGWIDNEKLWLDMLDDRNKTSHTYKQQLAHDIYNRIKTYYPMMQTTYDRLHAKFHP
ncbi:MAG: nucleotidyltransferase [Alphaproteobacteria bacterium]|nr:nucleotidyltransferase [Alphaproteobacteria bacterium]